MKVVILAAGKGERLGATDPKHLPKPLTQLANGKSILEQQIDHIISCQSLSRDAIFVVVGYQKEAIMERFPDLTFIYNPLFAEENTAKSLLRAANKIDDDLLWLNGDVVFKKEILEAVVRQRKSCMVVNRTSVGEEEVKYCTNEEGRILEVSKQVVNPQGEALGINCFLRDDLSILKKNLKACQTRDYFEKGIETSIQQGVQVWSVVVKTDECAEIDFIEDLKHANDMLMRW